jgi:hypothetical protein
VITKVLVSAAIALAAAVGAAATASADPTLFGVLSCGCQEPAPTDSAVFTDNVKQGIQQGLSDRESGTNPDLHSASR